MPLPNFTIDTEQREDGSFTIAIRQLHQGRLVEALTVEGKAAKGGAINLTAKHGELRVFENITTTKEDAPNA